MDSGLEHIRQYFSQGVSQLVVPFDNVATQSAHQGVCAERVEGSTTHGMPVVVHARHVDTRRDTVNLHAHAQANGSNNFLIGQKMSLSGWSGWHAHPRLSV